MTVEDYTMGAITNNASKSRSPNRRNKIKPGSNADINERDRREEYDCSTRMIEQSDYNGETK